MGFIIVLMLTTFAIAGSAAAFSVYGLAQIFAAAFIPVVVMGASLEAGKLVAASYVYRFWKDISFLMKTYLLSAIFVLMVITSAGIFGFLSAAYQTDTLSLRDIESQVELLESEKAELYERKRQIDADIGRISANYITKRMELIDKYSPETNRINNRIPEITADIHKLKSQKIQEESHVGPIIYIAKVFNKDTDDATKWMILLIIFAFDPLAVALTIATNNAMLHRKDDKLKKGEITDKAELQAIHDQAHEMYEMGGINKESLREFDELTDIVNEESEHEPMPPIMDVVMDSVQEMYDAGQISKEKYNEFKELKDEEEREVLHVSEFTDEEIAQLEDTHMSEEHDHLNAELVAEPEPAVETPDDLNLSKGDKSSHVTHAENTLKTLIRKEKTEGLTKEEHSLKRLLTHMQLHHMPVPTIKGGDDEHFITGEAK